jgi:hypothetical protein
MLLYVLTVRTHKTYDPDQRSSSSSLSILKKESNKTLTERR